MTDDPADEELPEDSDSDAESHQDDETNVPHHEEHDNLASPRPLHGHVRHSNLTARVPESVGNGRFCNGVLILTGQFEIVLDFSLRIGELHRIVARSILPRPVAHQFASALRENIGLYENRFGPLPDLPIPRTSQATSEQTPMARDAEGQSSQQASSGPPAPPREPGSVMPPPSIQDVYDDLKLGDEMLSGRYANAVLIRHSGTEFCFDFITNIFPRSAVSERVLLATPHVRPFLLSLNRGLNAAGPGPDFLPQ